MHPIERLRAVARSHAAPPALLAREAAAALGVFGGDAAGLVTACRRLIDRQPACAQLWWLASRVLSSLDPAVEAWASVAALEDDQTEEALTRALDARTAPAGAPVVVRATALGPGGFVCERAMAAAMRDARDSAAPVWVVAPLGTVLPGRLWASYLTRLGVDARELAGGPGDWDAYSPMPVPGAANLVACSTAWVSVVIGPTGLVSFDEAVRGESCPVAPELLRISA